jgi:histidine triad (HIT) family protein
MEDCIFCKIIEGKIPSKKVYEDEKVFCFLDVNPKTKGHLLVIPKKHYKDIFETPSDYLESINVTCKRMAILLKEKLGATGVNILNASGKDAQQSVFHLHYHVMPRYPKDGLDLWFHGKSNFNEEVDKVYKKLTN